MKIRRRHQELMTNPAINGWEGTARVYVPGREKLSGKKVRRWMKVWRRYALVERYIGGDLDARIGLEDCIRKEGLVQALKWYRGAIRDRGANGSTRTLALKGE